MAHSVDTSVTVEGVETEAEAAALLAAGADVLQGYLYGRPMPQSDLIAWAKKQQAYRNSSSA